MPKVPLSQGPQIDRAALPGARLGVQSTPDAFGAGIARGAGAIADVATSIAFEAKAKADETASTDAYARLQGWSNKRLHDPKTGALTTRGKDSFDLPEKIPGEFDKAASDIETGLTNDTQRQAFARIRASQKADVDQSIMSHVARESERYEAETHDSAVAATLDAAINSADNPAMVEAKAVQMIALVDRFGRNSGKSPEWIKANVAAAQSSAYRGAVSRLLSRGDDMAGKAAFERWSPYLTGEDKMALEGTVKVSSTKAESQRLADDLIARHGEDMNAILDETDKIADTDVRQQTEARALRMTGLRKQAKQEQYAKDADSITKALDASGGDPDAIDSEKFAGLPVEYQDQVRKRAAQIAEGLKPQDNSDAFIVWRHMATDDRERKAFLETDLRLHRTKFSDGDFDRLSDLQIDMRKGSSKLLNGYQSRDDTVKGLLVGAGLDPNLGVTGKDRDKMLAFNKQLDSMIIAEQQAKGRELSPDEVAAQAESLLVKGTIGGWFWGETITYAFESGQAFRVEDVPATWQVRADIELRKAGIDMPTDAEIIDYYNAKKATNAE